MTQAYDPAWKFRSNASAGRIAGIDFWAGFLDTARKDYAVRCSLDEGEFPLELRATFVKHFLSAAACAICGNRPTEIELQPVSRFHSSARRNTRYVVCKSCGCPNWRISFSACFAAERLLLAIENSKKRKESLRRVGGKHSSEEIREILKLQLNRCIYCNAPFSDVVRPTKDHLLPISDGGTDYSSNIVLACRGCNSHRGTIPFHIYCSLLSPARRRRIQRHMDRRIRVLELKKLPTDAFKSILVDTPKIFDSIERITGKKLVSNFEAMESLLKANELLMKHKEALDKRLSRLERASKRRGAAKRSGRRRKPK